MSKKSFVRKKRVRLFWRKYLSEGKINDHEGNWVSSAKIGRTLLTDSLETMCRQGEIK